MKDIKWLLKEKGEIEEALKADDITPTVRLILQEELERFEKLIAQNREEWNKLFEQQEIDQLKARVSELEGSNKELREIICEFAHYLACPAYVLRPGTVKKITDIAAEERIKQ